MDLCLLMDYCGVSLTFVTAGGEQVRRKLGLELAVKWKTCACVGPEVSEV